MPNVAYTTLDTSELLAQARDTLHAIELDHYRLALRKQYPQDEARLKELSEQRVNVAAELDRLTKQLEAETATEGDKS